MSDSSAKAWSKVKAWFGCRLTPAEGEYGFELAIDATRSEYASGDAPEHGVELHGPDFRTFVT